ncbi:MAG: hypothetical protein IJN11_05690 [Oscillospiraceae bacterium]|nr:hypothetical protein [Oscillospiraceae bacterium]
MSSIAPGQLGGAIAEALTLYSEEVQKRVDKAGQKAVNELVRKTKDTAPFDVKAHHRHYVDCIASKKIQSRLGFTEHVWYVKAPCYRLTHLLVHGHETRDGGRTRADPFLQNALDEVLPEYEAAVEEAIQNG